MTKIIICDFKEIIKRRQYMNKVLKLFLLITFVIWFCFIIGCGGCTGGCDGNVINPGGDFGQN